MAKKKKRPTPPRNDTELIGRVKAAAPEVLTAKAQPSWFETVVDRLLEESSGDRPHFYCRPCGEYHLKTHTHFKSAEKTDRDGR